MNTVLVNFDTAARQITEMFQWPKWLRKKMTEMPQRRKTAEWYKMGSITSRS